MIMRDITIEELRQCDGIQTSCTWIAYKGTVYDVSHSELFAHGKHYNHRCGADLTDAMAKAPHVEELIYRFPVVGKLIPAS